MKNLLIVFLLLLLAAGSVFAKDKEKDDDDSVCDLRVRVTKAENGKPIRNAAVIFHPVGKDGKQSHRGYEMKTDSEGNAVITLPYGLMRVQIIAFGFQTHGEDYKIEQPQQEIEIKMNPPKEQHSIYK